MASDRPRRMPPVADVVWAEDEALRSAAFDDVYASRDGALAETRMVFLEGCGLPQRWRGRRRFSIAELGFGTGLNAIAAWDLWRRARDPGAVLHFVSVEGFPLSKENAARALAPFAEVADLSGRLLARWPVRAYGPQRFVFPDDGFVLTVLHDEAATALKALEHPFDAWFLDGFAPARNPAMWSETILSRLADLTAPGAVLATYSAAAAVRRCLEKAGFEVRKAPGFGAKRERLLAVKPGDPKPEPRLPKVAVIGGGVAGAATAQALAWRGAAVTLLCAGETLADAASGNPAGLVMPRLDRGESPAAAFLRAAYLHALDLYRQSAACAFTPCGVEQRPDSDRAALAFQDLLDNPPWPQEHLRPASERALFHVQAGMLDPVAAIAALTSGLDVRLKSALRGLHREEGGWRLEGEGGQTLLKADAVVLAAGAALNGWDETRWLPLALSAGQIEFGPAPEPANAVTQGAYCGPMPGGVVFGATFAPTSAAMADITREARAENLARLTGLDPDLAAALDPTLLASRAAVRATTADRLPILGPAPDQAAWRATDRDAGPRLNGLWLFGGLGARGLTLAPLLAESLASRLCGEPDALYPAWRPVLDPARFLIRALKRGETLAD